MKHARFLQHQESIEKLKCEQTIIEIKKTSLCPLIFSNTKRACPSASEAVELLASQISKKNQNSTSVVITYFSTIISFALLGGSIPSRISRTLYVQFSFQQNVLWCDYVKSVS